MKFFWCFLVAFCQTLIVHSLPTYQFEKDFTHASLTKGEGLYHTGIRAFHADANVHDVSGFPTWNHATGTYDKAPTLNALRIGIGFPDLFSVGGKVQVWKTISIGADVGILPDMNLFNGKGWWKEMFPVQYLYGVGSLHAQWHFATTSYPRSKIPQWYVKPMIQLFTEGESLGRLLSPLVAPTLRLGRELNINAVSYFSVELGVSYFPGGLFEALPSAAIAFNRRL